MTRVLLLDGDIFVHRLAHVNQYALDWSPDCWSYWADFGRARAQWNTVVADLLDKLWADRAVICLSDSQNNWRHGVLSTYKNHRTTWKDVTIVDANQLPPDPGPSRPLLYAPLRRWLLEEKEAIMEPALEADDLLGLMQTEDTVIVTVDHDLLTVPGSHFNPDKPEAGVITVTEAEATRGHLYQVLVGDPGDGYRGCPGVGPVKAKKLLDASQTWDTVVRAFEKAGLTAHDALLQARVARVLQGDDYNFETKEIRLWQP